MGDKREFVFSLTCVEVPRGSENFTFAAPLTRIVISLWDKKTHQIMI